MPQAKILMLIPLLALCVSLPASAQMEITAPGPGPHFFFLSTGGGGFPPPLPPMIIPPLLMGMRAAHLTAEQQKQIETILEANRSKTAPLVQQLQSVHEQIADKLLGAGTVSSADLAPLENQAAQLDAQIQQQALGASVQIRGLLTPDQITRMAQFHQKMAALQAQMKSLTTEAAQPAASDPTPLRH